MIVSPFGLVPERIIASGSVGYGDGLYKSTDGGASFKKVGLENSEHIGKIVVHPKKQQHRLRCCSRAALERGVATEGSTKQKDGGKVMV